MDKRTANLVLKSGLPCVLLDLPESHTFRNSPGNSPFVELLSDSKGASVMAAEHLFEKQFRHYGFVGYHGQVWSTKREAAFVEHVQKAGFYTHVYRMPLRKGEPLRWEKEEAVLEKWVASLPKRSVLRPGAI